MMIRLDLRGSAEYLTRELTTCFPAWDAIEHKAARHVRDRRRGEVLVEQAIAIAYLASQYDRSAASILEVGASHGYTAALMRLAAPQAEIVTLEPHRLRRSAARQNLRELAVAVRPEVSMVWLEHCRRDGLRYNMIFVDADHKHIAEDLAWYDRLKIGGLFLHHDYSREGSAHPCPPVYDALNEFAEQLGHPADVLVIDDSGVGMAGWYKRGGETWPLRHG